LVVVVITFIGHKHHRGVVDAPLDVLPCWAVLHGAALVVTPARQQATVNILITRIWQNKKGVNCILVTHISRIATGIFYQVN
jgi:hypothetical protein